MTKNLVLGSAVRGFHVNKRNVKPEEGELLKCSHKEDNLYDIFSMKVCKSGTDEIAGYLPMQTSRITKFIVAGGVSVTLKIIGKYNWRNHLIQGGLEGSCEMTVMTVMKCCQPPAFNSIWKGAKRTLYRTKEQRDCLNFPFSREWRWETSGGKIAAAKKQQNKEEVRSRNIRGMLPNPRSKKVNQENYCT